MSFDPATQIQQFLAFGEFGDVNPSICDSSTYTFMSVETMEELFEHEIEGCFLYSRHWNPTNKYLAQALARMEDAEACQVMASGMAAISTTLLQLCEAGTEIVSARTVYGGTYALLANVLPRFGITTHFVDLNNLDAVKHEISDKTRVIYGEGISNPLLEVADIPALSDLAHQNGAKLVIDNTFSPLILSPLRLGADVVVHSMTKFINGMSDCVAGCVIANKAFIDQLNDIHHGTSMLLGPVMDSIRAAGVLKNLHTLHVRMVRHSANALYLAQQFAAKGIKVHYPGLEQHQHHARLLNMMNQGFGYGGILTIDVGDKARADALMKAMQKAGIGYLAVSLGYFKTLFSPPSHSTSSEIPADERAVIGLGDGLIRFSVGLDNNIERTWNVIQQLLQNGGIV